jgi:hypothetical protein
LEQLESIGALIKSLSGVGNVTVGAGQDTAEPSAKKTAAKKNEVNNDQPPTAEHQPTAVAEVAGLQAPNGALPKPGDSGELSSDSPPETDYVEPTSAPSTSEPISLATDVAPVAAVAGLTVAGGTEITAENATGIYQEAITCMGDMTANMAQRFEKVELDQGKMVVTLLDAYNTNLCSKPERKAKIESAIKELTGTSIRIDFVTTANRPVETVATKPKLSRIQQTRELQQHPFVKEAIDLFDGEISDFHQRRTTK